MRGWGADGHRRLRRETAQGKGKGQWPEAKRHRPLQIATQPGVLPPPPPLYVWLSPTGPPQVRRLRHRVRHLLVRLAAPRAAS